MTKITSFKSLLKDKYSIRGIIYSLLGLTGIAYEVIFRRPPELIVLILYLAIVGIGIITVFYLKEQA